MSEYRTETDSLGAIDVPADCYWGAQTQRAIAHFAIGNETLPDTLIRALARVKMVAARVNRDLGRLPPKIADAIENAAQRVMNGELLDQFPLAVWQSGSGTPSNMNMNEVLANVANEQLGQPKGSKHPVHPNDHCNLGQSTNDTFPTAIHVATVLELHDHLLPAMSRLHQTLAAKVAAWGDEIKIGRTHFQDATPLTLGQEFSGYAAQIALGKARIVSTLTRLYPLAQGGTAVGTGLNTHAEFATRFAAEMADITARPFISAENKFEALAAHDALVELGGQLNTLAVSLNKIANDIRMSGSGPRSGLGELILPSNEPGSSIMPGKVNPTQCEALTMVCAKVMGNHTTVTVAGAQGQFELNVFKPLIAQVTLQSIDLLAGAIHSFDRYCLRDLQPNRERLRELVNQSLMLVTALAPEIGYDQAAEIAKNAHTHGTTLREEAIRAGISADDFDRMVQPQKMLAPMDH